jgi:predicted phosphodiesterase
LEASMKILMVADQENNYIWDHFESSKFKDIELIISSGDLKNDYLSFLVTMLGVPLYYVTGNHDLAYSKNPPGGCDCIDDKLVTYKGLRILGLGGCMKYGEDIRSTVPPFQYSEKQMEKRIKRILPRIRKNKGFDILVTHSPAFGIGDGKDICHTGFKSFLPLLDNWKPRIMIHGHMHMGFGRAPRFLQYCDTAIYDAFNYYILDIDT